MVLLSFYPSSAVGGAVRPAIPEFKLAGQELVDFQ